MCLQPSLFGVAQAKLTLAMMWPQAEENDIKWEDEDLAIRQRDRLRAWEITRALNRHEEDAARLKRKPMGKTMVSAGRARVGRLKADMRDAREEVRRKAAQLDEMELGIKNNKQAKQMEALLSVARKELREAEGAVEDIEDAIERTESAIDRAKELVVKENRFLPLFDALRDGVGVTEDGDQEEGRNYDDDVWVISLREALIATILCCTDALSNKIDMLFNLCDESFDSTLGFGKTLPQPMPLISQPGS